MSQAERALIVVHPVGRSEFHKIKFDVWIDGRQAGNLAARKPTEFHVDPGTHTFKVANIWLMGSQRMSLDVAAGSKTDLTLVDQPWFFLRWQIPVLLFGGVLYWWASRHYYSVGSFLILCSLAAASYLIPPLLIKGYWSRLILKPMTSSDSGAASSAAT